MSDRPWDDADRAKRAITQSAVVGDPTDSAAGVDSVSVEFGVTKGRPWELAKRSMRSSLVLDADGVYELSVRFPETDLEMSSFHAEQMLDDALGDAIQRSTFPGTGYGRIRGGQSGWNPHAVWSGEPQTRHYNYDDMEAHRIDPKQAVRKMESVIGEFRKEVDANR